MVRSQKRYFLLGILLSLGLSMVVQAQVIQSTIDVMEVSQSHHSIIINRGNFEGVKIGDKAKFVLQGGTMDIPQLSTVAYGEAIKVHGGYSYWYLTRVEDQKNLKAKAQLLFIPMKDLFSGRSEFRIKQDKIVLAPTNPHKSLEKNIMGQKQDLVKGEEHYNYGPELVKTTPDHHHSLETKDYTQWRRKTDSKGQAKKEWIDEYKTVLEGLTVDQLEKVVEGHLVRKVNERLVFESVTDGTQEKINNQESGLKTLYHEQRRDEGNKEFQSKSSFLSIFEEYRLEKQKEAQVQERAVEKMKMDSKFWSGDMNDEELHDFFVKSQLSKEVRRRRLSLEHKTGHEIVLRFERGLTSASNSEDSNYQGNASGFQLGYEFHLMRATPYLDWYSLEIFYGQTQNYYDGGSTNVKSNEKAWQFNVNRYFFNYPSSVEKIMAYAGAGLKTGKATLTAPLTKNEYLYGLNSFPVLQGGVKYRFDLSEHYSAFLKVGLAVIGTISYEMTQLNSSEEVKDGLNGSINANQLKLYLGTSILF